MLIDRSRVPRLVGALSLLCLAVLPAKAHQAQTDVVSSSTAVVASGTVGELVVVNELSGQSSRHLGLRLDDGQSFELVGPSLDTLGKGARVEATGVVSGHAFQVTQVTTLQINAATATLKSPTTLSGTLLLYHKDFFDQGRGEYGLAILGANGEIVQLTVAVIPGSLEPGMAISAEGTLSADGTWLDVGKITVTAFAAAKTDVAGAPVTNKVLVLPIRFADSGGNPFTPAQIDTEMQTNVAPYYQEVSYGQQLLNVTVIPSWLQDLGNIPIFASGPSAGQCDYDTIGAKADALATALGYNLANYQNRYYVLPNTATCGWAGLAYVGFGRSWSNGYNALWVYGHELGHNFGLWHAGSLGCTGQVIGGSCSVSEYGDPFDVMGNIRQMHFNAMQKARLNWIPGTSVKQHVAGTQTYQLSPLETGGQPVYAVTVQASATRKYWVEFRQPIGFDAPISSLPNLGAQIRVGGPSFEYSSGNDDSQLLDTTPGTAGGFDDAALLVGQTFADSTYGISFHVISATASTLTLSVTAAGATPAPLLQGAVSRKVHGAAGTFNLPLTLTPITNPTTEPRQGPAQTIVFTFDKPVTAANVAVTEGIASAAAPTFSGNDVIVSLTGVANAQYVTVALSGISSADGGTGGTGSVRVGFLLGDANQNRVVTVADIGVMNAQMAQAVTAANYLKDVNASGTLSVADIALANSKLTTALPAP